MSWVAVAIGGGAVIGYLGSQQAAGTAAGAQRDASEESSRTQLAMYNQNRADSAPWRDAGVGALGTLQAEMPELTRKFTMSDFQADPGYQFNLAEGQKAIQRSAAARGLLNSTRTMKDLSNYSQGVASNEYGKAVDRFTGNQNQRYNMLSGISGTGQVTNAQTGAAGMNTANNISANQIGAGNATAAQAIAGGNALNSALGTGMNSWMNYQMMNRYGGTGANPTSGFQGNSYFNGSNPYAG